MQAKRKIDDDNNYSQVFSAPVALTFANVVIFRIIKSHANPHPNNYYLPYLKFQFNGWEAWHIMFNQDEMEKIITFKELPAGETILCKRYSRETSVFRENVHEKDIIRFWQNRNNQCHDIIIPAAKWKHFRDLIQHLFYFMMFKTNVKQDEKINDLIVKNLFQILIHKHSVYSAGNEADLLKYFNDAYPDCTDKISDTTKATLAWI